MVLHQTSFMEVKSAHSISFHLFILVMYILLLRVVHLRSVCSSTVYNIITVYNVHCVWAVCRLVNKNHLKICVYIFL